MKRNKSNIRLGVNVDHVATIRQARFTSYPSPLEAALAAIRGGADQITIHLREDRRHIQDADLEEIRRTIDRPLNLEMAASDEIVEIACRVKPQTATLVPERRQELTTEGGLDVAGKMELLARTTARLKDSDVGVSLFIDPDERQIDASLKLNANAVELHTGAYCDATNDEERAKELERLRRAAGYASKTGMRVCAGHGLNYENTHMVIEACPEFVEYNIGHAIVARAIFVGMEEAVREMRKILDLRHET